MEAEGVEQGVEEEEEDIRTMIEGSQTNILTKLFSQIPHIPLVLPQVPIILHVLMPATLLSNQMWGRHKFKTMENMLFNHPHFMAIL